MAAGRRHPTSKVRGGGPEELSHVRGLGQLGGDTPGPRSEAVAERSYPMSEVRGGREKHLVPEARGSYPEEPL